MRDKIVITWNIEQFREMVGTLREKPKKVDKIGLLYGKWGFGKTTTIEWYFANSDCFYVRSLAAWGRSLNMMVEDILKCYQVESQGILKRDFRELIQVAKKHQSPLFIDEADRVVRKSILIETIRDVHDLARIPVILVGGEDIIDLLQRRDLGHIFSRITGIVEYKPLTAQDIIVICRELCSLDCGIKVALKIQALTLGDFRLFNTLLTKIEGSCSLSKTSEITMSILKKASESTPGQDDLDSGISAGRSLEPGMDKPLKAVE